MYGIAWVLTHHTTTAHNGWILQGRLGHGDAANQRKPKRVEALLGVKVVGVAAGNEHMLCITDTGDIYGWGSNTKGCLGLSASNNAAEAEATFCV